MPRTIDEVIDDLTEVIDWARGAPSRAGFFAALYRKVTIQVKADIAAGRFEDGARMERLDVLFADRYLAAVRAHRSGATPTRSWQLAFDAARAWRPLIVQHLLLGINAHINLDLGAAAADVSPGSELASLRNDFMAINDVLAGMVGGVVGEIGDLSPWIGVLDRVGGRTERTLINFSLDIARDEAWGLAERLAPLDPAERVPELARRDEEAFAIGRLVRNPGALLSSAALLIKLREAKDIPAIIDALADERRGEVT